MSSFIENPTLDDVEIKHRDNFKDAVDKLTKAFTNDTWDLTVYKEDTSQYDRFGKCVIMYWTDPYTFKFGVLKNDSYRFQICDSTWDTTVVDRILSFEEFHSGEIEFFVDSINEFFAIKDKLRKFTSNYNDDDLPSGYKRSEKIEQLLA